MIKLVFLFSCCLTMLASALVIVRLQPPDEYIAYVSNRDGNPEVYRISPDGDDLRQLTFTDDKTHCWLNIAPNGHQIIVAQGIFSPNLGRVYDCSAHTTPQLAVLTAQGELLEDLSGTGATRLETLSPQGDWMVYADRAPFTAGGIMMKARLDGRDATALTPITSGFTNAAWSPDGQWIAYFEDTDGDQRQEIVLISPTGRDRRAFSLNGERPVLPIKPAWSPDGRYIAVATWPLAGASYAIYRVDIVSGELLQLTNQAGTFDGRVEMQFSPDGTRLYYLGWCQRHWSLCYLPASGGVVSSIGHLRPFDATLDSQFALSPDGEWVVFSSADENGNGKLFKMHIASGTMQQLTFGAGVDLLPTWSPVVNKPWSGARWLVLGLGLMIISSGFWHRTKLAETP